MVIVGEKRAGQTLNWRRCQYSLRTLLLLVTLSSLLCSWVAVRASCQETKGCGGGDPNERGYGHV